MKKDILNSLEEAQSALNNFISNNESISQIESAANLLIEAFKNGNSVYSFGNGGSMSDAIHFAEELSGRFRGNRAALPATAISDVGHISCVSNDYGYEFIFSRYLEAHLKKGDIVLAISTSGTSANVILGAKYAKKIGAKVIALTGKSSSELGSFSDIDITAIGGNFADRVQELHIKVIHILIELVERNLFPENY